jgi:hypothetical protein
MAAELDTAKSQQQQQQKKKKKKDSNRDGNNDKKVELYCYCSSYKSRSTWRQPGLKSVLS